MSCENGIPYGTGPSEEAIGAIAAETEYAPKKVEEDRGGAENKTLEERAEDVIDFFLSKDFSIEFAIGVAGVWVQESRIEPWNFNQREHDTGGNYRGKHGQTRRSFNFGGKVYFYTEENMKLFGYGKGLAQWSWDRVFKFRDWYNGAGGTKTQGLSTMDEYGVEITATSMNTQLNFAWLEMQERRGEFMKTARGIQHVSQQTNPEKFKENIKVAVDAITRGYENGSNNTMASVDAMNSYSGNYWGIDFKVRYEYALGIYEKIKDSSRYAQYLN